MSRHQVKVLAQHILYDQTVSRRNVKVGGCHDGRCVLREEHSETDGQYDSADKQNEPDAVIEVGLHGEQESDDGDSNSRTCANHHLDAALSVVAINQEHTEGGGCAGEAEREAHNEERDEGSHVSDADAVVERHTVVIPSLDAVAALAAVTRLRSPLQVTGVAVAKLVVL